MTSGIATTSRLHWYRLSPRKRSSMQHDRVMDHTRSNRPRGQQKTYNSHDLRRHFKEDDQEITRRPNDSRDATHPESVFPSIFEFCPRLPQASAGWLASVLHQYPDVVSLHCNRSHTRKRPYEGAQGETSLSTDQHVKPSGLDKRSKMSAKAAISNIRSTFFAVAKRIVDKIAKSVLNMPGRFAWQRPGVKTIALKAYVRPFRGPKESARE